MFPQCFHNVSTMFPQCFHNVSTMFPQCFHNVSTMFPQCFHNVSTMFPQCFHNVSTMFPQCFHNVSTMFPQCFHNVSTMFPQCFHNVSTMFPQCFHNVSTMFPQCFHNVSTMFPRLRAWETFVSEARNVSELFQKHFLLPKQMFPARANEETLFPQHCFHNNVSSFAAALVKMALQGLRIPARTTNGTEVRYHIICRSCALFIFHCRMD